MSITAGRPVLTGERRWAAAGEQVSDAALRRGMGRGWWLLMLVALGLLGVLAWCLFWVLYDGTGVWGNNVPVTWALDIVSYDWWIGVACGGLFVSALLLLLGVERRNGFNRLAETTALIAASAAGLYPIIHLGRPWFFYWNLPYPNTFALWPQFRSPLYWDAIDIISLLLIAQSFWYVGMLPDLAAMRDRAIDRLRRMGDQPGSRWRLLSAQIYGIAALGWRGSVIHWQRWDQACRALALFGLIVVVSLQTGAAVMFAGTIEPGWHDALLPVSYLLGALFSGVGVVAATLVVLRSALGLRHLVTERHLNLLGVLLLVLGIANLYCYAAEFLTPLLTGTSYDRATLARRLHGPLAWPAWMILGCALIPVQLFWIPALRRAAPLHFIVGLLVALGIWADHYMVIVTALQHDFLPSSVHRYETNLMEIGTFLGTAGLFLFLLLLAARFLPMISIAGTRRASGPEAVRRG